MGRKKMSDVDRPSPRKVWIVADIDQGIQKLRRRIADVKSLGDDRVRYDDDRVTNVESDITGTIEEVFGTGSREHNENVDVEIRTGPFIAAGFRESEQAVDYREQQAFLSGIPRVVTRLEGLINRLQEKREDFKRCPKCNRIFENMVFCQEDGTPLVTLSYDPDAVTLVNSDATENHE